MLDAKEFARMAEHSNDFIFYPSGEVCVYVSQVNLWAFVLSAKQKDLSEVRSDLARRGYHVLFSNVNSPGFETCNIPNETWIFDQLVHFTRYAYLQ